MVPFSMTLSDTFQGHDIIQSQNSTNGKSYMIYRVVPFQRPSVTYNLDFKVTVLL